MSCGFQGNADIYGIGIRVGYYTQALAVWFSNYFLYREIQGLRAVNNLFLLALCIAATIYFVDASSTYAIEGFLMLQIGLVIGLVGITERSRYSSKYVKNSRERILLRMVIIMAGGFFNVCFWWRELERMQPTPCGSRDSSRHSTYIFYFYKTCIYGWARILMKVQSLIAIVWTAPKIITFDAVVLLYDARMRETRRMFIEAVESLSQRSPSQNHGQLPGSTTVTENRGPRRLGKRIVIKDQTTVAKESAELLKNIDLAMKYVEKLFSIYPMNAKAAQKKRTIALCGGLLHINKSQHDNTCTYTSATLSQCLLLWLNSHFTNKPSFDLRWRLAVHMTASGQHARSRWPRLLHHMYTLNEASPPPDWRHVTIASDILLTQIPIVITRRAWIFSAAFQFALIIILILQVELTIVWNHVSGLQSLSSLGQLIPFILGVGGLIKVLWGKWTLISKGINEEKYTPSGRYEDAMAKFVEKRKASVEKSVVRAMTA